MRFGRFYYCERSARVRAGARSKHCPALANAFLRPVTSQKLSEKFASLPGRWDLLASADVLIRTVRSIPITQLLFSGMLAVEEWNRQMVA